MYLAIGKKHGTDVLKSQVELERTPGAAAVSDYMAEGGSTRVLPPSPISARSQKTNSVSSLVNYGPSSNRGSKQGWNKKQKRGYHRIQSVLQYWQANGFQVLWVMLSTAEGGNAGKLAYHHQVLRQRVERKLDYPGLQHYQVRTSEGNGVLHIFWAWRALDGFRRRSFYADQAWLGRQWEGIHGATMVWIARVKAGRASQNKISRYCMSQYVSGQAGYEYMSWSWGRTFGFPMVACWRWLKRKAGYHRSNLLLWWRIFLSGGDILGVKRVGVVNMAMIKVAYREYGAMLWDN